MPGTWRTLAPREERWREEVKKREKEVERNKHFPLLPSTAALGLYQGSC